MVLNNYRIPSTTARLLLRCSTNMGALSTAAGQHTDPDLNTTAALIHGVFAREADGGRYHLVRPPIKSPSSDSQPLGRVE